MEIPMPEAWLSLDFLGYPEYFVSNYGRVYSVKRHEIMMTSINCNGYYIANLKHNDGNRYAELVHRLVAMAFFGPRSAEFSVDHIDRNRLNNVVANLRWATRSEQRINSNNDCKGSNRSRRVIQYTLDHKEIYVWPSCSEAADHLNCHSATISVAARKRYGIWSNYRWLYEQDLPIPGEVWKEVPYADYKPISASSLGRIKMCSGKITYGGGKKYKSVSITKTDGKSVTHMVHRLVAAAFYGNSELQVNHKDGNAHNNNINNLEYVTAQENTQHAHDNGLTNPPYKPIAKVDMVSGRIVDIYPSQKAASKDVGLDATTISGAKDRYDASAAGYRWVTYNGPMPQ